MFNIPVISSSSRFAPDSSGMMHLNALNASLSSSPSSTRRAPSSSSSSCSNCLPSYEEAVSNGPLFGLFNLNGGDTNTRHHHRHHHHRQQQQQQQRRHYQQYHDVQNNNNSNNTVQHHIHFPQSYHGPSNNNDDSYSLPTYQEVLSPGGNGRESSKSPSSRASSRMESRDDNAATRLEGEALEERLSRMALSESSKGAMLKPVQKTPRENKRRHDEKLSIPKCNRKDGNGNDGKQKQAGAEKSTLSVAKDRIFRVFSPMLSRKSDRHRSASAKPFSRKTPISSAEDENSEEEKTSLPLRMCVAPSRDKISHVDHFDNLKGQRSKQHKKKKVPHKRCHRTKQYHENF